MNIKLVTQKVLIAVIVLLLLGSTIGAYAYFDSLEDGATDSLDLGTWDYSHPIYTSQQFYDFVTSPTSLVTDRYHLANDIDFTGFVWDYNATYNTNIFRGLFDGKGFTISNITVTSTDTASIHMSLFSQMNGATIQNVTVDGYKMGFDSTYFNATSLEAGVFASNVTGTGNLIENITLSNVEVIANSLDGAGGLVASVRGNADLTIKNIKATNVTVLNTSKRSGGLISRIFAGSGTVIIEDIDFQGFVGAENRTSNTGGILGTAQATVTTIDRAIVSYIAEGTVSLSDGQITMKSDRYAGGFIGNNNNTLGNTITDSFYTGELYENRAYIGSAVGREKKVTTVLVNTFYSNVLFSTNNTAPTSTTGIHATLVNASSMPNIAWWNNFATTYYSANSLWTQDGTGMLELIR